MRTVLVTHDGNGAGGPATTAPDGALRQYRALGGENTPFGTGDTPTTRGSPPGAPGPRAPGP
ncbi:hypothetical protein GCM10018782_60420 [Streptomyces griseoaurantiacus]|nr:hypothetical protein GCM10018782_60420 [Streptomyces griseoaurantiacus]